VGGEDSFSADSVRSDILPGDRFLLCSDGLSRSLDNALLTQLLQEREAAACCKELVSQAIARGSTDNVTALVVDCGATHAPALTEALNIVSL
jgi:serine/threonine protein phosphatase PrpC